jgi:hypothetical protein
MPLQSEDALKEEPKKEESSEEESKRAGRDMPGGDCLRAKIP